MYIGEFSCQQVKKLKLGIQIKSLTIDTQVFPIQRFECCLIFTSKNSKDRKVEM